MRWRTCSGSPRPPRLYHDRSVALSSMVYMHVLRGSAHVAPAMSRLWRGFFGCLIWR